MFIPVKTRVKSLRDTKYLQVFWTLLRDHVDLNNAVVWILYLICHCTSLFYQLLWTVPWWPTIIDITLTFIFHTFFISFAKINEFFNLFAFFYWSIGTRKSTG